MAEAGFPGIELEIWQASWRRGHARCDHRASSTTEFVKAAQSPDVERKVAPQAIDITTSTPEEFAKLHRRRRRALGKVIRDAGIKPQ